MNRELFTGARYARWTRRSQLRRPLSINHRPSTINDLLARAARREWEYGSVPPWPMECDSVEAHIFRCVCCGKLRGDEERREPGSEVCLRCVQDAGFFN